MPSWFSVVLMACALLVPVRDARAEGPYDVDLLLVLAADVSRSVDAQKFRLQRDGYASAITNRRVLQAIESGPQQKIAVVYVEWAALQTVVIDWTIVANRQDAERMAERFRSAPRSFWDRTAIGDAIAYSTELIARSPYRAPRAVIDVSGDGTNNAGMRSPVTARQAAIDRGITVNGLAILSDVPLINNPNHTHPPGGLLRYFENNVVGGPGAFAIAAEGFEAFGTSLVSKLVKEIVAADDGRRVQ